MRRIYNDFHIRNYSLERIDTGDYTPEEYEGFIRELQLINRWLGDSWALRRTLLKCVAESGDSQFSLLDVGAGSGELLRVAAKWAKKKELPAELVGLELNERSFRAITEESAMFDSISAVRADARAMPYEDNSFDYVVSSLFAHHFVDEELIEILKEMKRVARRAVFVIDLHRHPVSYYLYTTIGRLFLKNVLIREDGALSILRGFKPQELVSIGSKAGLKEVSVTRHFPFRLVLRGNC